MADFNVSGGCQCGSVRYTIDAPASDTHHCHCGICRKLQGAIFVTLSTFPKASFHLEKGEDNLSSFESSEGVNRRFCTTCGSHLFIGIPSMPDIVIVQTGNFDQGAEPSPDVREAVYHAYVDSKVPWHEIKDDLRQQA
jgi:hypothetical protein